MIIFVIYGESGTVGGRILANQLKRRLNGQATVLHGTISQLDAIRRKGVLKLDVVLNTWSAKKFPIDGVVINDPAKTIVTRNRLAGRVRFRTNSISAPEFRVGQPETLKNFLPAIGRTSLPQQNSRRFWQCFQVSQAVNAKRGGASHFVQRIDNSREFRVHVVADRVDINDSLAKNYKVVKISERRSIHNKKEYRPVDKKIWHSFEFCAPIEASPELLSDLRVLAKEVVFKLGLHFGSVSFLVGADDKPLASKIDIHMNSTEDQSGTIALFSNAICKMLDKEPLPLVREEPSKYTRVPIESRCPF